jgi:hypothetical protein
MLHRFLGCLAPFAMVIAIFALYLFKKMYTEAGTALPLK